MLRSGPLARRTTRICSRRRRLASGRARAQRARVGSRALARGSQNQESVARTRNATEGCARGAAAAHARHSRPLSPARDRETERVKRGRSAVEGTACEVWRGASSRCRRRASRGVSHASNAKRGCVPQRGTPLSDAHGSIRQLTGSIQIERTNERGSAEDGEGRRMVRGPARGPGPAPGPVPAPEMILPSPILG